MKRCGDEGMFFFAVVLALFLFYGEPDIHEALLDCLLSLAEYLRKVGR